MRFKYQYINFYNTIRESEIDVIKQYKFYRVFNVGIAKFGKEYLYSVRMRLQKQLDASDKLVPGNLPICKIDVGSNFWWGRWINWGGIDITLFFLGDHTKDNFKLLNLKHYIPRMFYVSRLIENNYINAGDIRITNINDEIYIYWPNLSNILKVNKIINNNLYLERKYSLDISGKNQQIMTINGDDVQFIDWYTKYGVGIGFTYNKNKVLYDFITYDKFIILGEGSYDNNDSDMIELLGPNYGIMPKFSFSTPHIKIDNNNLLGVGHIKIYTSDEFQYIKNSNIDLFRRQLNFYMKSKFGDKYIRHLGTGECEGYIYMLYFYIIPIDAPENDRMIISDSYLPIYTGNKISFSENVLNDAPHNVYDENYKFSLVYPTGLEIIGFNSIVVTCGEGDFYSIALTFNLEDVINSCIHDVKSLDLRKYNYFLLQDE